MADLLKTPKALGKPVAGYAGDYVLGARPKLTAYLDGQLLWDSSRPYEVERSGTLIEDGYEAFMVRVDVELGIDQIPTATLYITGEDCARFAMDRFARGQVVEFRFGYDDLGEDFDAAAQERVLFRGEVVQGFPPTGFPPSVELQIDGASHHTRTMEDSDPQDADGMSLYIGQRLLQLGLQSNLMAEPPKTDEGVTQAQDSGTGSLLALINRWTESVGLHWMDTMEGAIAFFFPNARLQLFGQKSLKWVLPVRADPSQPDVAPILTQWDMRENYVDTPSEIVVPYLPERGAQVAEVERRPVEGGRPETTYTVPLVAVGGQAAAAALADSLMTETLWRMIQGTFTVAAGVPILPFDEVAATRGWPGLEDYYDTYFLVTRSQMTYDARGLQVRGEVRSVL